MTERFALSAWNRSKLFDYKKRLKVQSIYSKRYFGGKNEKHDD